MSETGTVTLTDFLLARIAEDEAVVGTRAARWAVPEVGGKVFDPTSPFEPHLPIAETVTHLDAVHIARWDPARVLAECAAKRRIVELHGGGSHECSVFDHNGEVDNCHWVHDFEECSTMHLLAQVYADHPDYRSEWATDSP